MMRKSAPVMRKPRNDGGSLQTISQADGNCVGLCLRNGDRDAGGRAAVKSVRAIDVSGEMVRRAQEKTEAQGMENVTVTQTDLFDTCLAEESFDAVLACNVLLYHKDRAAALARIRTLLKPQGTLLLVSDCLGEGITRERMTKWFEYKTGKRPYVSFDTMRSLEREVANAGFSVLARENLFPAPPNLFLAARKA